MRSYAHELRGSASWLREKGRLRMGEFTVNSEGHLEYQYSPKTHWSAFARKDSHYIPIKPISDAIQTYWLDQGNTVKQLADLTGMNWSRINNILQMRNWDGRRRVWSVSEKIRSVTADKIITVINPTLWYSDETLKKLPLYGKSSEQLLSEEIIEEVEQEMVAA